MVRLNPFSLDLPTTGSLPSFSGATGWLNSAPLDKDDLRGKVVLVDFWTYTCINWLRTLAWVRAWWEKYEDQGLVVVGVHTPEFPFERDTDNIRLAAKDMMVTYPVAIDSDYGVWQAFANNYWPAVYIADTDGRIRYHHFGEGAFEEQERAVQQLLGVDDELVSVEPDGLEAQADWAHLESPETYLGYQQGENFASPGGVQRRQARDYEPPDRLPLNHWALTGNWTIEPGLSVLNDGDGTVSFRFHARDVNLVMGPPEAAASVPFRVLVDGEPPTGAHGGDIDEDGHGVLAQQRVHQLVRQQGQIEDRTFEITFLAPGAEVYCFTFG